MGNDMTAVLMRIEDPVYDYIQKAKAKIVDMTEETIKKRQVDPSDPNLNLDQTYGHEVEVVRNE